MLHAYAVIIYAAAAAMPPLSLPFADDTPCCCCHTTLFMPDLFSPRARRYADSFDMLLMPADLPPLRCRCSTPAYAADYAAR